MFCLTRNSVLFLLLIALSGVASASCITRFVDSEGGQGSIRDAIEDVNRVGCTSGGMNEIIIDDIVLAEIVIGTPLPTIRRPAHLRPATPEIGRFVIRTTSALLNGYGLRASAPVIIENFDIRGDIARRIHGGIRLEAGADGSRLRGVRVDHMRSIGISLSQVNDVIIEPSNHWPVVVTSNGFGQSPLDNVFAPGIQISDSTDITVQGALLGVDESNIAAGNCTYGIDVLGSTLVMIGGNAGNPDHRNVVADNHFGGVRIQDSALVTFSGNYIGVANDGSTVYGNGLNQNCLSTPDPGAYPSAGVVITGSDFVGLGEGTAPNTGSYIVGNQGGVLIDDSQHVLMLRNRIGLLPDENEAPNVDAAIRVRNGAGSSGRVLIGSEEHTRSNWLVGGASSHHGVVVDDTAGEVQIRTNRIYGFRAGGGEPIQRVGPPLVPSVTEADSDTGVIAGMFAAALPADGVVDLFSDFAGDDEARFYLGSASVKSGDTTFSASVNALLLGEGRRVSATYTQGGAGSPGTSALGSSATAVSTPEWIITPSASSGGSISPALPQVVSDGQRASFLLSPRRDFVIGGVRGSCGGVLNGDTFTTSPVTADCTVIANFVTAPRPDFSATPNLVDFGAVRPGSPVVATVTIENFGRGSGRISGLRIEGSHARDFGLPVTGDGCTGQNVPAGASCQFQVVFQPSDAGLREARVEVDSDDPDAPLIVRLSGSER